jgi:hypothetical protein
MFRRKDFTLINFSSKAQAFTYLFSKLISKGEDELKAAEKAKEFANIVAEAQGLPDVNPIPKNGIQKGIEYVQQLTVIKSQYPEVWDILIGAVGGLAGGFIGNKVSEEPVKKEEINFDELQ